MKNKLLFLLFIFLLIPGISLAVETHTLDIEFAFSDPGNPEAQLMGYRLYKEGLQVCETNDPGATGITCDLFTEDGTFDFTLTAFYGDGTESPPSSAFPYTIETIPDPIPEPTVDNFTISAIGDQINGVPFRITVEARDSSSAIATWFTGTAGISDTTGSITPGTTGNFSNGIWSGNVTINNETSNVNITIQNGTSSGTSNPFDVNAPPQVLDRIVVTPTAATILTAGQQQFTAQAYDTTAKPMTVNFTWTVVNGGTIDQNGLFTAGSVTGSYSNTVKVSAESLTAAASVTVTEPQPPTAVLSSSPTMGDASLTVDFDGSASTTPNLPIVSHSWNFGDGERATGKTVSHTYTKTGGYTAELTVQDNLGLISTAQTPIIVTEAVVPNEKPIAAISIDPPQSDAPLTVSLDGSQSSDPDGTITQYKWHFGDGTTGNSQAVKHTYTEEAVYTVSLEVTDDRGDTATKEVIFEAKLPEIGLNFEIGEVEIDSNWVRVTFKSHFIDPPVVIAGPPTKIEPEAVEPVLIRIRNIDQEGFEIRLQEWDYQDDKHAPETFSYIAMEKGVYSLDDEIKIEAGSFTGTARFQKISLQQPYDLAPVILTQIVTENETDAVTGRIQKSGQSSFEFKLQEMEKTKNAHGTETIDYIAWKQGKGKLSGLLYEAGLTPESVDHEWFGLNVKTTDFPSLPLFIAKIQTYEGRDTAALRTKGISQPTTWITIEEEQSKDRETDHAKEVVGYLIIGSEN